MTHDSRQTDDKLELHYRQQLSALVDGELAPDEARFLLRRLQHDGELSGRFERWQLCGDVLRGQVRRAAAPDLAARVAAAVAAAPAAMATHADGPARRRPAAWTRWGGGAALAASVAAVAVMFGHPDSTGPVAVPAAAVAQQALPSTEAVLAAGTPAPAGTVPATTSALAAAAPATARPQRGPLRNVATAAAARRAVASARAAEPAIATAAAGIGPRILAPADPFASSTPLQARPWPRAVLGHPAGGAYTASFGEDSGVRSFYPFEPHPPAAQASPAEHPAPAPEDDAP